ncbi:MAG: ABC transporter permease [Candidatus Verstraetearchaeota archaeon]|jgi:ABC-type dipeptide/oligopeptide/nickel transport system permease subunit|nr:ABC transporter permease [Candidatus Verstraetearchaeota archaeon]
MMGFLSKIVKNEIVTGVLNNRRGLIGLTVILIFTFIAITADIISPYDPWKLTGKPYEPPSINHPLGCNDIGQDILSEVIYGSRVSLAVGFSVAFFSTLIGICVGLISGYYGGILDEIISRGVDVLLALPSLPLIIILAAYLGPSIINIIFVLSILGWGGMARVVRAQTLSLRERAFVESCKAVGMSDLSIVFKVILPNMFPIILAESALRVTGAILSEAGLSFLGLGDPTQKSWGMILYYANTRNAFFMGSWLWVLAPGLCIAILGTAFYLVSSALDEVANPRLRRMR